MTRKYTAHDIAERVRLKHDGKVTLDESLYTGLRKKCQFIDIEFGPWITDPWSVINGRGHPKRGMRSMALKQTRTRESVEQQLREKHGDAITLGFDYTGVCTKCTFIDKDYGPWTALPQHVLAGASHHPNRRRELSEATCFRKYGVRHHMHDPLTASYVMGSRARSKTTHWKTGKILTCASGYERAFVEWCNRSQIDFDWQIKHDMPDGRVYYVDAQILSGDLANTWIEIKGFFRNNDRSKWDWFHATHPNSQLWMKQELQDRKIL